MKVDPKAYRRGLKDGREGKVPDLPMHLPPSPERTAYALGWRVGMLERRRAAARPPQKP